MHGVVDTRDRLMTATAELFRRQGDNGTSLMQVTDAAGAPVGSLHHSFPRGTDELAEAVIASSGRAYLELFARIADAAVDLPSAVTDFFDGAAAVLEGTGYLDACPIGTVALEEAGTDDRLRAATDAVFRSWVDAAASRLQAAGIADDEAWRVATPSSRPSKVASC